MGGRFIDGELSSLAELYYNQHGMDSLIVSDTVKNFGKLYTESSRENRQNILCSFYGPYGAGIREAAAAICRGRSIQAGILSKEKYTFKIKAQGYDIIEMIIYDITSTNFEDFIFKLEAT